MDASDFLYRHPWPASENLKELPRHDRRGFKLFGLFQQCFGKAEASSASNEEDHTSFRLPSSRNTVPPFDWNESLMQDFRKQLEKLICLDFIMRNTDRGAPFYSWFKCLLKCSGMQDWTTSWSNFVIRTNLLPN